jgi:hypothetical protein
MKASSTCTSTGCACTSSCASSKSCTSGRVLDVGREVRPVAQVAAAAHHGQVDAGLAALHLHRQDVDVLVGSGVHRLLVQHLGQRAHLVAQLGGLLEFELLGMRQHALLQLPAARLACRRAGTPRRCARPRVVLRGDQLHAGTRAALDLVQQAGPGSVGEHRVLAGAQAEHLLQQLDGFLHRPGARIRPEVAVLAVDRAAVVATRGNTSGGLPARARFVEAQLVRRAVDLQVGVALVVAEQDVEARRQRLDEVVLEQQRLGLGAHHGGLHARDARDHVADARAAVVLLEVAGDALLQVARLAHVEHAAVGVEVAVDAGQLRQRRHLGQQLVGMRAAFGSHGLLIIRAACSGTSSAGSSTTTATLGVCWRLAADLAGAASGAPVDRRRRRPGLDGAARRCGGRGPALDGTPPPPNQVTW